MKITSAETILLTGPCTNDPYLSEARKRRSVAIVRIKTDTEFSGLGETYAGDFIPEIVPGLVRFKVFGKVDFSPAWQAGEYGIVGLVPKRGGD